MANTEKDNHAKQGFPIHPLAEIFPLHDGPSMWELREDIKEHGLIEEITIWKGKVLDGRRRQACCLALGIRPRYVQFKGTEDDAIAFVISKNLKRRHLGEAERALVAATIAKMPRGGDRGNQHTGGKTSGEVLATIDHAAELLNVSSSAVDRAKSVVKSATPALVEAVKDGTVTLTDAAKVAKQEPAIQDAAVEAVKSGKTKTATQAVADEIGDDEPDKTMRDALGILIQPHAKEAFEAVEKFDELLTTLRRAKRLYSELASMPGGAYLLRPGISVNARDSWKHKGIETALMNVADCKPSLTVCPYEMHEHEKHDENCSLCHGLNWTRPIGKKEPAVQFIEKLKAKYKVE